MTAIASQTRVPVVRYAARSKSGEDQNESVESQFDTIERALSRVADRVVVGRDFFDYASGSKGNRGPDLQAAIEAAIEAADTFGEAELWVAHSSRLGRGTGKKGQARALGLLLYELRAKGVTARSAGDDEFVTNEQLWGIASSQSAKYALDLSEHVRRGYRKAAERGTAAWLARGIRLDGYTVTKGFDAHGRVTHTAKKDEQRAPIFELIWSMAAEGRSLQAIQLELSRRGYMTKTVRRDHKSGPFDAGRVGQILDNPAYAAKVVHLGEVVGDGQWPAYVTWEEFQRIRDRRRAHAGVAKRTYRKAGRPPVGYLLANVIQCGRCGTPMQCRTARKVDRNGNYTRRYTCPAHSQFHKDSAEHCDAAPIDAQVVDSLVLSGIDRLLADAGTLRTQIDAGRIAAIERAGKVAEGARKKVAAAEAAEARAQRRYEKALDEGDDDLAEIAMRAALNKKQEADRARTEQDRALDKLNEDNDVQDADVLQRVWRELTDRREQAEGDVAKLNMALRETFDTFQVQTLASGRTRVVPVIAADALADQIATPAAFGPDALTAVALDEDGQLSQVWGEHLTTELGTEYGLTSQNTIVRSSQATMSSSPQRVR